MNVAAKTKLFKQIRSITPSAQLMLIALLSGLIYLLLFTLPFPLTRYYNTIPPVDFTKLTNYSPGWLVGYVVGISLLFLLYLGALRLTMRNAASTRGSTGQTENPVSLPFVLGSSFGLALISVFAYPLTAIDLFIYAVRTRGWAAYGLNPLAIAPEMLPAADPWLGLAAEWVDAPSPYGPLWEVLSLGLFTLSGGDFLTHLFALKLLMVIIYLGCAGLIYLTLRRLRPDWAVVGTLAFAWNPLVIFESVQNAHNDIVMTFFLLAAVWTFAVWVTVPDRSGRNPSLFYPVFICIFLALSVLVKFVTIIAVPFFLAAMAARFSGWLGRGLSLVGYGLLTLALIIVPMMPLWPGWEQWAVLDASGQAGRSLLALLVLGLRDSLGTNAAFTLAQNLLVAVLALIYLFYFGRLVLMIYRHPPANQIVTAPIVATAGSLFWYVLLAAPVFHAWYLLWFLPLAPLLLPDRYYLNGAVIFCISALLIIAYFETIRVWVPALLQNHFLGHLIGVPLLIAGPALAMLWPRLTLFPISSPSESEVR